MQRACVKCWLACVVTTQRQQQQKQVEASYRRFCLLGSLLSISLSSSDANFSKDTLSVADLRPITRWHSLNGVNTQRDDARRKRDYRTFQHETNSSNFAFFSNMTPRTSYRIFWGASTASNKKLPVARRAATSPVVRIDSMMAPPIFLSPEAAAASSVCAQARSCSAKKDGVLAARNSLASLVIVSRFTSRPRFFRAFVR